MRDLSFAGRAAAWSGRLCVALLALTVGTAPARARQGAAPADSAAAGPQDTTASPATPVDTGPQLVSGRIVRPGGARVVPVPDVWVTLHRVGSDTAGPLDSMRTGADGRYTFHYRRTGSADAVYFVSAFYHDIAYFSLPLTKARVTGDDAEVTVFDTTSAPVPLHVRGRHIVVSAARADGTRDVVEVYELSNDSSVTRISPDDAHPTWSGIIPAEATDFQPGQGDISPSSFHVDSGRVSTVAPFAPGLKQLSFSFRLPSSAFPLTLPIEHPAVVLEVLVEDPTAQVTGARLARVSPATVDGRTFDRYLAQDVPANAVVSIAVPSVGAAKSRERTLEAIAIAVAVVMFGVLATVLVRRRGAPVPAPAAPRASDDVERLAHAIAALDAEHEQSPPADDDARAAYRARRDELKRQLAAALDARRGRT